eukprot:CAMPEP_0174861278 /NCGR_PEP_ID=MMETSP1114-20130205/51214_1 /TAXON_ID=312471 /ORGANISM="Neobodo designis, Strain CCAP 1951/1" /LENGTH=1070 /DNA_ID=CAMNT_0016096289 /DNA_START=891 /DNA_END=4103 /DNA_ORIENTATION=-
MSPKHRQASRGPVVAAVAKSGKASPDSPGHSRSNAASGSSSLGLEGASPSGPMSWARAVELCRDSQASVGALVMQAAASDDTDAVASLSGETERERQFLAVCADFALSAHTSRIAATTTNVAAHLGRTATVLAERYDETVASPALHASFVAALCACGTDDHAGMIGGSGDHSRSPTSSPPSPDAIANVDLAAVATAVARSVGRTFPGPDPMKPGCATWFTNHTALLTCVYNTARELVMPSAPQQRRGGCTTTNTSDATPVLAAAAASASVTSSGDSSSDNECAADSPLAPLPLPLVTESAASASCNHPRLQGGAQAVAAALPIVEKTTDLLNQCLSLDEIVHLRRNRPLLACLARVLSMSSVVDPSALPEGLTASLNECFAKCTRGLDALLSHADGLPVVRAVLDDLARGLNARRHVMPRVVALARDTVGKHAVAAFLDHTAKVSKGVGSDVLHVASSELLAEARSGEVSLTAAVLPDGVPTIVAMACHPHASDVVPHILRYADGYHAVAFSAALNAHADALRLCAERYAGTQHALTWAAANPSFASAVVCAHTRLGRDLVVLRTDIEPTAALKSIDNALEAAGATGLPVAPHKVTGRVCFPFVENGSCGAGAKCAHLHVDGAVVNALCTRDCCCQHGSADFAAANAAPMAVLSGKDTLRIIDTTDHSRCIEITPAQLSFTAGLAVYVARDHNIGLPIESDALCRQHSRCSCQKPQQCKYIHVCRQVYTAVAEWSAPPPKPAATATAPTVGKADSAGESREKKPSASPVPAQPAAGGEKTADRRSRNKQPAQPQQPVTGAYQHPPALPPPMQRRPAPAAAHPPHGAASESSASELNASRSQPMRRVRHTPYSSTTPPLGASGRVHSSAFDGRSPSVASSATSAARRGGFVTHVDASPVLHDDDSPNRRHTGASFIDPHASIHSGHGCFPGAPAIGGGSGAATPELRGHHRQMSGYTTASAGNYSVGSARGMGHHHHSHRRPDDDGETPRYHNVSESPLAVAMGSASRGSRRASHGGGGGGGRSVTSSVSHGANTAASDGTQLPQYGHSHGLAFGPGHSTPTPTTNRTASA